MRREVKTRAARYLTEGGGGRSGGPLLLGRVKTLQGYLAYKKPPPRRTLQ